MKWFCCLFIIIMELGGALDIRVYSTIYIRKEEE